MQHKLESQNIGNLKTLDVTRDDTRKMRPYAFCGHFSRQQIIGWPIRREEAKVSFITFVSRAGMGNVNQLLFQLSYDSSTLTRTYSSIIARGASVGHIPSSPRGSSIPPAPPMKGGPLRARGGNRRPRFSGSLFSAHSTDIRK